jgi:hypothetical protein
LWRRTVATASSTSAISLMPVESRTGLPFFAMYSTSGRFEQSADAILNAGMPRSSNMSMLFTSQPLASKVMPRERAWSRRPAQSSVDSSSFSRCSP